MNQSGFSWPETILTLSVLMVIFGTLLPFATNMTSQLHNKKLSMQAAETAYHAAAAYEFHSLKSGNREIDGTIYSWTTTLNEICVSYNNVVEELDKCVSY